MAAEAATAATTVRPTPTMRPHMSSPPCWETRRESTCPNLAARCCQRLCCNISCARSWRSALPSTGSACEATDCSACPEPAVRNVLGPRRSFRFSPRDG